MATDAKIMEALARLEHKVDVLLRLQRAQDPELRRAIPDIRQVGDPQHKCTLCQQTVEYTVDPIDSVVVRKCGCKTGKIALDMKAFAPPALPVPKKESDNGEQQQEDRGDAPTGKRSRGR